MATYTFLGECPASMKPVFIESYGPNDKLRLVVETTADYKKTGIYSAERDDISKPIVIDWGDGTIEQVNGDVSQKVHTYASVGTFNVIVKNIKSYAATTGNYAWDANKYTLKEVVAMPDSMTSIGDSAFADCNRLISTIIGNNIVSIGNYAFAYCINLISMTIPNGVTSIGRYAFYESFPDGLIIPNSVANIGGYAFRGKSLNETGLKIYFESPINPNLTIGTKIHDFVFMFWYNGEVHFDNETLSTIRQLPNYPWTGGPTEGAYTIYCSDGTVTVSCILKGTKILLADGTAKNIEDLTYNDMLKVWDFDEGELGSAKVCWLTRPGLKNWHYYQLTFDNGTVLKTTGINSNHRIFSVDQSKFTNVCDAKVGDKVFSIDGVLTITDVQLIQEQCEYYNVMTSGKINCFANGILTSDRYGNLYPIVNMKYVKDGRTVRPYSEYEAVGIDRYWYDNLRLGENDETVEKSKEYVWKCLGQMLPLPAQS